MNLFRLVGDLSHLAAILILLLKIWKTRSCAGISGKQKKKDSENFFKLCLISAGLSISRESLKSFTVYFIEIEALFVQLNQNVTTDCHVIYIFFTQNCLRNNLTYKIVKSMIFSRHSLV